MKKNKHPLLNLTLLVSLTSASIYATNKLITASATIRNLLHGHSKNYFNWRFGKIHYAVKGNGTPLLLIHDLNPCNNIQEWKEVVNALAQDHTVYAIDLLGCGCSDRPKMTYTNYLYVQLITDFIKSVIKEPTDIITSGLSGSFAIMACKNDPSLIRRIMMINPEDLTVLNQIPTRHSKIAKNILELPLIGTLVYNILMARFNIDLLFTEKYMHNPFHVDSSLADIFYESAHLDHGNGKYLFASLKGKYVYCNIAHAVKSINNSIFILQSEEEPRAKESAALYASLNSSIEYEILPGAKHLPHLEFPEKVFDYIETFFD